MVPTGREFSRKASALGVPAAAPQVAVTKTPIAKKRPMKARKEGVDYAAVTRQRDGWLRTCNLKGEPGSGVAAFRSLTCSK